MQPSSHTQSGASCCLAPGARSSMLLSRGTGALGAAHTRAPKSCLLRLATTTVRPSRIVVASSSKRGRRQGGQQGLTPYQVRAVDFPRVRVLLQRAASS